MVATFFCEIVLRSLVFEGVRLFSSGKGDREVDEQERE